MTGALQTEEDAQRLAESLTPGTALSWKVGRNGTGEPFVTANTKRGRFQVYMSVDVYHPDGERPVYTVYRRRDDECGYRVERRMFDTIRETRRFILGPVGALIGVLQRKKTSDDGRDKNRKTRQ